MDTLPEELLTNILSHIHNHTSSSPPGPHPYPDTPTLYSLCLTSRKLHRLALPHLYTSIHSTSGAMGTALHRALSADTAGPLRRHVRCLAVQHAPAGGCLAVKEQEDGVHAPDYGATYDVCQVNLQRTLELLPALEVLDLSRFPPRDEGKHVWLSVLWAAYSAHASLETPDWAAGTGFARVRRLALHMGGVSAEAIWMVFRLPALRELEIDVRTPGPYTAWEYYNGKEGQWPKGTSGVEVLRVVGVQALFRMGDLRWMSEACRVLKSVFVSVSGMDSVRYVPRVFEKQIQGGGMQELRIVVDGLWVYEVDFMATWVLEEDDYYVPGDALMALMIHATGHHGMGEKNECFEGERVRITSMRELSADEKKAYDIRRPRRP